MTSSTSRKMIAALQVSLDGFTQGSDQGGVDWVDSWADGIQLVPEVDAFVQGGGMYPGYGEYWAAIYANPQQIPPYATRVPYEREIDGVCASAAAVVASAASASGVGVIGATGNSTVLATTLAVINS